MPLCTGPIAVTRSVWTISAEGFKWPASVCADDWRLGPEPPSHPWLLFPARCCHRCRFVSDHAYQTQLSFLGTPMKFRFFFVEGNKRGHPNLLTVDGIKMMLDSISWVSSISKTARVHSFQNVGCPCLSQGSTLSKMLGVPVCPKGPLFPKCWVSLFASSLFALTFSTHFLI